MKRFVSTLTIWLILVFLFTFFFAGYLLDPQHIYRAAAFLAVVLAVATELYTEQSRKIEGLEKRIQELEEKQ